MTNIPQKYPLFTTRDLLTMAVLAAMGGVASTYIQMFANAVQAFLGFPGATQWAAGFHVLWIVLAAAITGKPGSGVITAILKGSVEFMTGNTHGVIILVVNLMAGLMVDFGFLLFKNKQSLLPYILGGALASGSNVLVFQFFARVPLHILTTPAILILLIVATLSGVIFSGLLPKAILHSLIKAGVVTQSEPATKRKNLGWIFVSSATIMMICLSAYLLYSFQSPEQIEISGAVRNPFSFPDNQITFELVKRNINAAPHQGFLLYDLIEHAEPSPNADTLLMTATDGYSFLISFDELKNNPNILLLQQGSRNNTTFNVIGPQSSKAWIRNVKELHVIAGSTLEIKGPNQTHFTFNPDLWIDHMDSTEVTLPTGSEKLQGVPVYEIIEKLMPLTLPQDQVYFINPNRQLVLPWDEISENRAIRIFTVIDPDGIKFALARMSGEVLLFPVDKIEVQLHDPN